MKQTQQNPREAKVMGDKKEDEIKKESRKATLMDEGGRQRDKKSKANYKTHFLIFWNGIMFYRSGKKEEGKKYTANQKMKNDDIYHTMECVYHSASNVCLLCRKVGWVTNEFKKGGLLIHESKSNENKMMKSEGVSIRVVHLIC